jgi:hypothetical protein
MKFQEEKDCIVESTKRAKALKNVLNMVQMTGMISNHTSISNLTESGTG